MMDNLSNLVKGKVMLLIQDKLGDYHTLTYFRAHMRKKKITKIYERSK